MLDSNRSQSTKGVIALTINHKSKYEGCMIDGLFVAGTCPRTLRHCLHLTMQLFVVIVPSARNGNVYKIAA